ncbi:ATP-grasp domain-containing protein [Saccharopolyspora taberi]|uniref:ATP-grasp domain-containing protein n=1 Tax=Saccharopolyspora taberi TaxID=60895 RepID=UPI0031D6D95E
MIAVTGVGGTAGYSLAQRLHEDGYDVLGLDADSWSPGFVHAQRSRLIPTSDAPDFVPALRDTCREARADALISTVESELLELARKPDTFDETGTRAWIPDAEYLRLCLDKLAFYEFLSARGFRVPHTASLDGEQSTPDLPGGCDLIVKPRFGRGAKDTFRCRNLAQARSLGRAIPGLIVQPRIEGDEFTADCLVDRAGRASIVLRIRRRTKAGVSVVSETIHHDGAARTIAAVLDTLGASGVCNVQGFLGADSGIHLTEVNPRFAGGFPLSERAGAQLTAQYLNGLFRLPVDHRALAYRTGVIMRRYFTNDFEEKPLNNANWVRQEEPV